MDGVLSTLNSVVDSVYPHWPGLAFIVVVSALAQTLKSRVFTRELAIKNSLVFWSRRVFPVLLLVLGVIPGLTWPGEVYPGIDTTVEKIWYFIACAGISILGFNIFKQWVKRKYDVDFDATSIAPPPRKVD